MGMRGAVATTVLVVVPLGMGVPGGAAGQATIGGEWRDDVEAFTRKVVDAGLTPGIGVAVAIGDWVAYAEGFGSADLDTGRPVSDDTPFYIASSTKSLTATAVLLAVHRGEIELDAPMVRYLPEARLPDGVDRESITVRDLLAMTHGLSGGGPVVMRTAFTGEFTRDELLDLLRHHEPTGAKGEFEYNNLGYNLLGMILESVCGESWKDVVRRTVLEPAGMMSTSARLSRLDPDRLARPHDFGPDGFAAAPMAKEDANLHAAGGHFASARDLARYLAVHQTRGNLDGRRVLPAEPLGWTHERHVEQDREFGPYHRFGWGYGWDLGTYEGDTVIHRFGGFAGYRSHMSFMPEHGIGVAVLVNGSGIASPAADLVASYIYDRLLGKPELQTRYAARLADLVEAGSRGRERVAEHRRERAARLAPLPHRLEAYAGVYHSPVLGRMEWRVVGGGLEMRLGVLESRAEVYDAIQNQLRVELAGGGRVVTFQFPDQGGPAAVARLAGIAFERVEGYP